MQSMNNHTVRTKCPTDMKQIALERKFDKLLQYAKKKKKNKQTNKQASKQTKTNTQNTIRPPPPTTTATVNFDIRPVPPDSN